MSSHSAPPQLLVGSILSSSISVLRTSISAQPPTGFSHHIHQPLMMDMKSLSVKHKSVFVQQLGGNYTTATHTDGGSSAALPRPGPLPLISLMSPSWAVEPGVRTAAHRLAARSGGLRPQSVQSEEDLQASWTSLHLADPLLSSLLQPLGWRQLGLHRGLLPIQHIQTLQHKRTHGQTLLHRPKAVPGIHFL